MKQAAKKAQVYGLSTFLYALAIAIVLVIGLVGMSKEFSERSEAGLYRFGSVITGKNAELIKKLLDQERSYALDKSLFITAAHGGYSSHEDLVKTSDCSIAEGVDGCYTSCTEAMQKAVDNNEYSGTIVNWACGTGEKVDDVLVEKGVCYNVESPAEQFKPSFNCYAGIVSSDGTKSCGIKDDLQLPYIGEKITPYWKKGPYNCVPDLNEKVKYVFSDFANMFSRPDQFIINSLKSSTGSNVDFNYVFKLGCFPGSDDPNCNTGEDEIEVSWFPVGTAKGITLSYPPGDPVIDYTFNTFVNSISNTQFFKIYQESKQYVDDEELGKYLIGEYKDHPIPTVIDEDFVIGVGTRDGELNCTTKPDGDPCPADDPRCGFGNEYCNQDLDDMPRPFRALVEYAMTYPDGTPNTCGPVVASAVSRTYPYDCTAHAVRQSDGLLKVTRYAGCNSGNSVDDAAIKCVLQRTINKINSDLKLDRTLPGNIAPGPAPHIDSDADWKYEFYTFDLTFRGTYGYGTAYKEYNETQAGNVCGEDCIDAELSNPDRYCPGNVDISGDATIEDIKTTTKEVDVNYAVTAQRTGVIQSDCRSVQPVKFTATGDCTGGISESQEHIQVLEGSASKTSSGTFDNFDSKCDNIKMTWTTTTTHPGDTTPDTQMLFVNPFADRPVSAFALTANPTSCAPYLYRGSYKCTSDADCSQGSGLQTCGDLICGPDNVCVNCGQSGNACCADDWCDEGLSCDPNTNTCRCGLLGGECCTGNTCDPQRHEVARHTIPGFETDLSVWDPAGEGDVSFTTSSKVGSYALQWDANVIPSGDRISTLKLTVSDWGDEDRNNWNKYDKLEIWIWSDSAQNLCVDPTGTAGRMNCWRTINLQANKWNLFSEDLSTLTNTQQGTGVPVGKDNIGSILFWDEGDADTFVLRFDGLRLIETGGLECVDNVCSLKIDECGNGRGMSICSSRTQSTYPCNSATNNTWGLDPCWGFVYEHIFDLGKSYSNQDVRIRLNIAKRGGDINYYAKVYASPDRSTWTYLDEWTGTIPSGVYYNDAIPIDIEVTLPTDTKYVKVESLPDGPMDLERIITI